MKTAGTKEWASYNCNICQGCSHDCRYCYAKKMAIRFNRKSESNWKIMDLDEEKVKGNYNKKNGRIMFPTSHDITPSILNECMAVLHKLVYAGNELLITTKPHLECVKRICDELMDFKDQIQFRFTVGSESDQILAFWEPGAPKFEERLECCKYAYNKGYKTSLSVEPMLSHPRYLIGVFRPYITESIWLGILNNCKWYDDPLAKHAYSLCNPKELLKIYQYETAVNGDIIRFKDTFMSLIKTFIEMPTTIYKKCHCCGEYFEIDPCLIMDPRSFCRKRECTEAWQHRVESFKHSRNVTLANFQLYCKKGDDYERLCPVCGRHPQSPRHSFCVEHSIYHILRMFNWSQVRNDYLAEKGMKCEVCGATSKDDTIEVHHCQPVHSLTPVNYRLIWHTSNFQILCSKCHKDVDHHNPNPKHDEKIAKLKKWNRKLTEWVKGQ